MRIILIYLVVAYTLFGCVTAEISQGVNEPISGNLYIPKRIESGEAHAYAYSLDKKDSTLSQISYQYFTPQFSSGVMDSTFKDSVNARIVYWASSQSPEVETPLVGPLTGYYFQQVVNDFTIDEQAYDDMNMHLWSLEMGFDIVETSDYVRLNTHAWSYTGGAHGNGFTVYEYFEKTDGNRIHLNYFTNDVEALTRAAEPYFREQQEIPDGMSYGEFGMWFENDDFALNDNFYFSKEEMVFIYNPYEIAPYAGGTIELRIPFSALEGILRP
jgi:hypothetical protein